MEQDKLIVKHFCIYGFRKEIFRKLFGSVTPIFEMASAFVIILFIV